MSEIGRIERQECEEIRDLLDDFISDELSVESNRKILSHLETCPGCLVERDRRKQIRKALKRACDAERVPGDLQARILNEFRYKDASRTWLLRIAATILLIILGGTAYLFFPDLTSSPQEAGIQVVDHYAQVVQDHLRCNGVPAHATPLPLDPYQQDILMILRNQMPRFDLKAVMECRAGDASFIHYVFEGRTGLLSVMIEKRADQQVLPSKGRKSSIQDVSMYIVTGNPRVIGAMEAPHDFVYIIGDNFDGNEIRNLAERLYPPLKRALF